jgi:hypothetical protein
LARINVRVRAFCGELIGAVSRVADRSHVGNPNHGETVSDTVGQPPRPPLTRLPAPRLPQRHHSHDRNGSVTPPRPCDLRMQHLARRVCIGLFARPSLTLQPRRSTLSTRCDAEMSSPCAASVCHRTDSRRVVRAGCNMRKGFCLNRGAHDELPTPRHSGSAMCRVQRRTLHTAHLPAIPECHVVRPGSSPQREVRDVRALLRGHSTRGYSGQTFAAPIGSGTTRWASEAEPDLASASLEQPACWRRGQCC